MVVPDNLLELSYIIPVYIENEDSEELQQLIRKYDSYPKELTGRMQFVLVDDGSPAPVSLPASGLNIVLARIHENIPWNQPGARNLGVMLAKTSKIILTDLDHSFSEKLLSKILDSSLPRKLYKFKRKRNGVTVSSHPNSFYCTKAVFYKALGYDEEFSGHYGHDDTFFIALQRAVGTSVQYFSRFTYLDHLERRAEAEADQPHFLVRDSSYNKALLDKKIAIIKGGDPFQAHSRKLLNFSYSIVV